MPGSTLLSTRDAARVIGVSHQHIVRLVNRGAITPAFRGPGVTGAFLFHPAEVERLRLERTLAQATDKGGGQQPV